MGTYQLAKFNTTQPERFSILYLLYVVANYKYKLLWGFIRSIQSMGQTFFKKSSTTQNKNFNMVIEKKEEKEIIKLLLSNW